MLEHLQTALEMIYIRPGMTQGELDEYGKSSGGRRTLGRVVYILEDMGYVERGEPRRDEFTKAPATTWYCIGSEEWSELNERYHEWQLNQRHPISQLRRIAKQCLSRGCLAGDREALGLIQKLITDQTGFSCNTQEHNTGVGSV